MIHQLLVVFVYAVIFLGIFFVAEIERRYFPNLKEVSRKTAHILCGITALSFPYYVHSHWVVLGLVLTFSIFMAISKKMRFLQSIHEVERRSYGSFYYPAAIYLIFLLASQTPAIYLISILTMTISDAFAALIGKKYGTVKYEVEGNTKSLEGSMIFLLVTFLCVHLPLLLMTDIGRLNAVFIALIIAILLTGFEAISPTGSDNIIVPFATYYLLTKMTNLPLEIVIQDIYILLTVIGITGFLSMLKPSGLIGLMLINYAAITLGNIYWLIPLLLAEILFFLTRNKEKYPLRTIFYIGIIPVSFIFLENTFNVHAPIFIPYLVSIAAQLPISHQLDKFKKARPYYSLLAVLFVITPSIIFYFRSFDVMAFSVAVLSILIAYMLNYLFHRSQIRPASSTICEVVCEKSEFRLRFFSTALGSLVAFMILYFQGMSHV